MVIQSVLCSHELWEQKADWWVLELPTSLVSKEHGADNRSSPMDGPETDSAVRAFEDLVQITGITELANYTSDHLHLRVVFQPGTRITRYEEYRHLTQQGKPLSELCVDQDRVVALQRDRTFSVMHERCEGSMMLCVGAASEDHACETAVVDSEIHRECPRTMMAIGLKHKQFSLVSAAADWQFLSLMVACWRSPLPSSTALMDSVTEFLKAATISVAELLEQSPCSPLETMTFLHSSQRFLFCYVNAILAILPVDADDDIRMLVQETLAALCLAQTNPNALCHKELGMGMMKAVEEEGFIFSLLRRFGTNENTIRAATREVLSQTVVVKQVARWFCTPSNAHGAVKLRELVSHEEIPTVAVYPALLARVAQRAVLRRGERTAEKSSNEGSGPPTMLLPDFLSESQSLFESMLPAEMSAPSTSAVSALVQGPLGDFVSLRPASDLGRRRGSIGARPLSAAGFDEDAIWFGFPELRGICMSAAWKVWPSLVAGECFTRPRGGHGWDEALAQGTAGDALELVILPHFQLPCDPVQRLQNLFQLQDEFFEKQLLPYLQPLLAHDEAPPIGEFMARVLLRTTHNAPYRVINGTLPLSL